MNFKRLLPIIILILTIGAVYSTGIHQFLSYESLREHRDFLKGSVRSHPYLSPILFMIVYALSTALSIPGGAFLSIFGGFLFPQPLSALYVVIGATTGATAIFLIAKTAFGEALKERAGSRLNNMRQGFQENAAHYLLFLRLVPLFPFWMVNLAPAFFGVSLSTFIWTTFIGIIPGAFVFTQAGTGLDTIFESGEPLSVDSIFNTQIKIALVALGAFALLPIIMKRIKKPPPSVH